ncbi:6554_t:CDS:2 [Paraglomus occultum]|uniref:6554_t:CDS:1 n=1 Tax=Paraglomus occultum TaxID=144539 RepID=A0A9N8VFL9_9GLOM|nr:6554_t:CDS:2 [Paraglomus occultum]
MAFTLFGPTVMESTLPAQEQLCLNAPKCAAPFASDSSSKCHALKACVVQLPFCSRFRQFEVTVVDIIDSPFVTVLTSQITTEELEIRNLFRRRHASAFPKDRRTRKKHTLLLTAKRVCANCKRRFEDVAKVITRAILVYCA